MNRKSLMFAVVALVAAGWASTVTAATANGPICETSAWVNSTTYYNCNGGSHTALDIGNGTCNEWNHRGMLVGNYYYSYAGGCAAACNGSTCNGGAGNYYTVTGGSGWNFRQLHFINNVSSGSKTCDRCALGLVGGTGSATGPHSHSDNRNGTTRHSAWYTNVGTTCGSSGYCNNRVGVPTL
ncbi:peptidase M23 [Pyxidicoccus parkwayensis]|uniref:Peptidase M23 n=1 Tax=Pyxidicoccus parkwayensis TaxID=2813578 RepID=A0ABX7P9F6_9BACT|nr:peptidase M23 [Pyxidicoccus parkwaysis]QSQ27058.1 peptidase M23 [Pyxidicoccus parkwaysis]